MAALWQPRAPAGEFELLDLRRLPMGGLDSLLREETETWRAALHWDFRPSADLVRRYVNIRALDGYALFAGVEAAGYIYWVTEDRKALIGDLFVRAGYRSAATENLLLEAALARLLNGPHFTSGWVRRVEGQLMQSSLRAADAAPSGPRPRGFPRHFLLAPAAPATALPPRPLPGELTLQGFSPRWIDEAARLIARVYTTHIDSEINDQYRTAEGSRRFLQNVVQYPGCGSFHPESSYLLLDAQGSARALCIASMVSNDAGHIPQICVDSRYQQAGLGYELLRRSMLSLARHGARDISLTVTADNRQARQLYERMGYRLLREFDALIWDGLSD
jgi:ribosomal protein S18 acetylase RimI-like enzyme